MNIKRVPIINIRSPIRTPSKIYNIRSSLCIVNENLEEKPRLFEVTDCVGNKFIYVNKFTNVSKRIIEKYLKEAIKTPYFYINVNTINNLKFVSWIVSKLSSYNVPAYIETDRDLSDDILKDLSINPFNVIQCNLSQVSNIESDYLNANEYKRIQALRRLPYKAKMHGLYVILCIDPIVPQVTQLKDILTTLVSEKRAYNHIIINFIKIPRILNAIDYVTFTNSDLKTSIKLDSDYFGLNLNTNTWECAKWYEDAILENIKYLVKSDNISVCSNCKNCRGIKLKESTKTSEGMFKFYE
jgi:hypothetical protein